MIMVRMMAHSSQTKIVGKVDGQFKCQGTYSYTSSGDSVSQTKLNGQDMSSYTSFDKCLSHKHTDPRLP